MWRLQPFLIGRREERGTGRARPVPSGPVRKRSPRPMRLACFWAWKASTRCSRSTSPRRAIRRASGPLAGLGHFRDARGAAHSSAAQGRRDHGPGQGDDRLAPPSRLLRALRRADRRLADGGYRRVCPNCNAEHFPRTDPVVIMLAIHGDACLVGRNKHFPAAISIRRSRASSSPGETIEEAVRRELKEEVRHRKSARSHYHATQPWPFPSSLMIGCFAEADSRDFSRRRERTRRSALARPRDGAAPPRRRARRGHLAPAAHRHRPSPDQGMGDGIEAQRRICMITATI